MIDNRFRVLMLADAATFHAERFATELRRQGCNVLLLSIEPGRTRHFKLRRKGPFKSMHYLLAAGQVRRIIKRFDPDIINPHFASGYGFLAALAVKGTPPIVLNLWGSDILLVPHLSVLHRWKTQIALSKASCVIGDSAYLVDSAKDLRQFARSRVIYWGIEEQYLSLHKPDYNLSRPLKIIVPRAHEPVYNNLFIVEALKDLINAGDIELTFPGSGSMFNHFRESAATLVGDRIRYYDRLDRDEFMKLMAGHDLFLSAASSDSSPVTLIEAMALGLIPVTAKIVGVKEWLNPESGHTFDLMDKESLARVIRDIIEHDDNQTTMRKTNLEKVKTTAIFERNVAEQIAIMRSLASGERLSV